MCVLSHLNEKQIITNFITTGMIYNYIDYMVFSDMYNNYLVIQIYTLEYGYVVVMTSQPEQACLYRAYIIAVCV